MKNQISAIISVLMTMAFCISANAQIAFSKASDNQANNSQEKSGIVTGNATRPVSPEWVDNAVFYQVYPQTYYDSNNDGVGDLNGIIEKLDYIKSLGVSAIWLNPFCESPFRDAGYDMSDFYKVAQRYGTNEDAKRLFDEAHKRGLHVIMDYVASYTSIDHPWFKASCDPKPNKYTNWYVWTNHTWFPGMDKYRAGFIQGYCERDGMFMNNFFWHQPALNYGYAHPDPEQPWQLTVDHPDVMALKEEMKNVMRFWLDLGCDGFRCDMAGALVKNDDGTENSKYWMSVRRFLDEEYPGTFMVSEWSGPKDAVRGGFNADFFHWFNGYNDLFQGENVRNAGSHGHSYFDAQGLGDFTHFLEVYMEQYENSKELGYISIPFGNHDLERIKNNSRTDRDLQVIFAFMLTMPGTPFIYYGDEIGMKQLSNLPYTEGSYMGRAGNRTPMQWNNSLNKGFSSVTPEKLYRAVDLSSDAADVNSAEKDPNSLLNKVKAIVKLRSDEPALVAYAEFVPVYAEKNEYPLAYIRANGKERLLVVLNPANRDESATFTLNYKTKKPQLISGEGTLSLKDNVVTVNMKGVSYAIFRINELK